MQEKLQFNVVILFALPKLLTFVPLTSTINGLLAIHLWTANTKTMHVTAHM